MPGSSRKFRQRMEAYAHGRRQPLCNRRGGAAAHCSGQVRRRLADLRKAERSARAMIADTLPRLALNP